MCTECQMLGVLQRRVTKHAIGFIKSFPIPGDTGLGIDNAALGFTRYHATPVLAASHDLLFN